MTKFKPYFQKFQSWSFFVGLIFFPLNMYDKEFSKWATFHMEFIKGAIILTCTKSNCNHYLIF
jgi:hypothetical protein